MKLAKPVNFAGRLFMPGENVKGQIPLDMIAMLQENDYFEEQVESEGEQHTSSSSNELQMTIEQFGELSAPEQKALLEQLKMSPGTNADQRKQQYLEWLENQKEAPSDEGV